jgi:LPS-assembly protein
MTKPLARWCCLLFLCAGSWLRAEEPVTPLVIEPQGEGEFDYNPRTGVASATNGVIVRYGAGLLMARQVILNQTNAEVFAEGAVHIEHEGRVWNGDRVLYNFKTRELVASDFRTGQRPFFLSGPGVEVNFTNRVFVATNAVMTTDDYSVPFHTVRARRITVVPGRYIEAKNATLYLGKVPVFYLPFMRRSLEHNPNSWSFTPGYRSLYGPFLRSTYDLVFSDEVHAPLHFDYYVKRGFGVGPDLVWEAPSLGNGKMRYYFIDDHDPGTNPNTGAPIPNDRQRFYFSHAATLRTNFTLKAMVRYQSDPFVTRDFFELEFREDVQPNSFVELNRDWPNWNVNLEVQPQVNNYQQAVERLPDLKLTGLRQQLGDSPFYYETVSSFGYFNQEWGRDWLTPTSCPSSTQPLPYAAMRGDTYHQVLAPQTLFGWLNLVPRAGERLSYYSKATGSGATTSEEGRAIFNTGAEMSFKASRTWQQARSSFLEVNGLRHVLEPSINYAYVPSAAPSPSRLPQFDTDLPTYWLLPLDYPDYNNIDAIQSQNAFRFSLGNLLQTRREGAVDDLLRWRLFMDWRLDPNPGQTSLSDLYSVVDLKPRSWLSVFSLVRYNVSSGYLQEIDSYFTLLPTSAFSWTLGQRYRMAGEFGSCDGGANLILNTFSWRMDENWGLRATQLYDANHGFMQEQAYTVYRDLRSWTTALTLRFRKDLTGPTDTAVVFTFSLKAFPRYGMNRDTDRATQLLGLGD